MFRAFINFEVYTGSQDIYHILYFHLSLHSVTFPRYSDEKIAFYFLCLRPIIWALQKHITQFNKNIYCSKYLTAMYSNSISQTTLSFTIYYNWKMHNTNLNDRQTIINHSRQTCINFSNEIFFLAMNMYLFIEYYHCIIY